MMVYVNILLSAKMLVFGPNRLECFTCKIPLGDFTRKLDRTTSATYARYH